ncbi:MAG: GNAT family N-acetyltransferase [Terriglobales bacterium]
MNSAFEIRVAATVEELEACVCMQQQVWRFADLDIVPRRVFVVARKIGGQTLMAWDGSTLAGFTLVLPGHRPGQTFWHSHMLAVAPAYRDRGLGRQLKLRQREEALAQGIDLIEWTFDPLEIKNGYFNLARLGAVARHLHPNLYGLTSSALQAGLPTDRLTAEWWLRSRAVAQLAAGEVPAPPQVVAQVAVPAAMDAWKHAGDSRAAEEQQRISAGLSAGFAAGLAAVGYFRGEAGGTFMLGPWEPA